MICSLRGAGFPKSLKQSSKLFGKPTKGSFDLKISRKKHIIIMVVIGLVYFLGVASIIYPIVGNMYSMSSSKSVITDYEKKVEKMPAEEKDDRLENAKKYNQDIADGIYDDGLEKSLCDENGLMCYVDIPDLDIYIPVYYGTSNSVLEKGCGWLENTSLPVGGISTHSCISAHTGLPTADMFTKLDQSKIGDMFYIHVLDKILAYQVDRIETVMPNNTELLNVIEGADHCTLLTCTPYGINDKRLLVRGVRVPVVDIPHDVSSEASEASSAGTALIAPKRDASGVNEGLQRQISQSLTVIIVIVAAAVVLFAGACVWLGFALKKASNARYAANDRPSNIRTRISFSPEDEDGKEE